MPRAAAATTGACVPDSPWYALGTAPLQELAARRETIAGDVAALPRARKLEMRTPFPQWSRTQITAVNGEHVERDEGRRRFLCQLRHP